MEAGPEDLNVAISEYSQNAEAVARAAELEGR
jgi:hypothetical protein